MELELPWKMLEVSQRLVDENYSQIEVVSLSIARGACCSVFMVVLCVNHTLRFMHDCRCILDIHCNSDFW